MNPSFYFEPCDMTSCNSAMMNMNMNGMAMQQMNFPMNMQVGLIQQQQQQFQQQQQQPMMNMPMGFQQQLQMNIVPSNTMMMMTQSQQQQPQANVVANDNSSSSAGSSVRSFVAERKPLAPDFVPGPYDVICARGSAAANSPGNLRFRKTIQDFLPEYSKATTKLEKSLLVTSIVDSVRDMTPNGGFVKKFGDRWYEVGDAACREKIGQCLRDQLHTKYKSSTKSKKPRRKELKELKKKRQQQEQQQKKKLEDLEPVPIKTCSSTELKDDENEMSLTNIFYTAMVDEELNLETIFRS